MRENEVLLVRNEYKSSRIPCGYSLEETENVRRIHRMLSSYQETCLVDRTEDAARLGVKKIFVKDESTRFGLKAFKGLGGFYAMFTVICRKLGLDETTVTFEELLSDPYRNEVQKMIFITTTDGNHGKGISWAAGLFGCKSYVFMPKGTVEVRAQAIRDAGTADVTITDMTYDECVEYTASLAAQNEWILVQDTCGEDYTEIPELIMKGYTTMLYEALDQMKEQEISKPTHVFLQAGVGAMAAAVAAGLVQTFPAAPPVIAIVEPHGASCIYESFEANDGCPHTSKGSGITIMAGLNCGTPCSLAWDIFKDTTEFAFSCDDEITKRGMRLLANASIPTEKITAGESGAVCAGLADLILSDPDCAEIKKTLGLSEESVLLLISTEGDTDPENYKKVVYNSYL